MENCQLVSKGLNVVERADVHTGRRMIEFISTVIHGFLDSVNTAALKLRNMTEN